MNLPQRFFLGMMLLSIFSMLILVAPKGIDQIALSGLYILMLVGLVGLVVSEVKERKDNYVNYD